MDLSQDLLAVLGSFAPLSSDLPTLLTPDPTLDLVPLLSSVATDLSLPLTVVGADLPANLTGYRGGLARRLVLIPDVAPAVLPSAPRGPARSPAGNRGDGQLSMPSAAMPLTVSRRTATSFSPIPAVNVTTSARPSTARLAPMYLRSRWMNTS